MARILAVGKECTVESSWTAHFTGGCGNRRGLKRDLRVEWMVCLLFDGMEPCVGLLFKFMP